jgi:hypothetical protein
MPKVTRLQLADLKVRGAIKEVLNLHPSVTDHLLYATKSDGVMGILRLSKLVPFASLRSGLALLASGDPGIQAGRMTGSLETRCRKIANSLRLNWPVTPKYVVRANRITKSLESKEWEILASQRLGDKDFRYDPLGNCGLDNLRVLSCSRYWNALKLGTNTFGVNVALKRADKILPVDCCRCKDKPESLGHVLGECVPGNCMRIQRHDNMVAVLDEKCEGEGYKFGREQLLSVHGIKFKPDIVIRDGERALIVDVTVRFESG